MREDTQTYCKSRGPVRQCPAAGHRGGTARRVSLAASGQMRGTTGGSHALEPSRVIGRAPIVQQRRVSALPPPGHAWLGDAVAVRGSALCDPRRSMTGLGGPQ